MMMSDEEFEEILKNNLKFSRLTSMEVKVYFYDIVICESLSTKYYNHLELKSAIINAIIDYEYYEEKKEFKSIKEKIIQILRERKIDDILE